MYEELNLVHQWFSGTPWGELAGYASLVMVTAAVIWKRGGGWLVKRAYAGIKYPFVKAPPPPPPPLSPVAAAVMEALSGKGEFGKVTVSRHAGKVPGHKVIAHGLIITLGNDGSFEVRERGQKDLLKLMDQSEYTIISDRVRACIDEFEARELKREKEEAVKGIWSGSAKGES